MRAQVQVIVTWNPADKENNYSLMFPQVPGCHSCCNSLGEVRSQAKEALSFFTNAQDFDEEMKPVDAVAWVRKNCPEETVIKVMEIEVHY